VGSNPTPGTQISSSGGARSAEFYADKLAAAVTGGRLLAPETVRKAHVVLRAALADAERLGLVYRSAAASLGRRPSSVTGPKPPHDLSYAGPLRLDTPARERW
jgi:Zn-dependent protease with chaperone function